MIKYSTIITTIITAALYTLGSTYYQGFLGKLGIEESLFRMAVDRTLFHGMIATTSMGTKAIMWFLLAAEGVVITAAFGGILFKYARKLITLKKGINTKKLINSSEDKTENSFLIFSYKMFAIAVATFLVYFGIILILMASSRAGKEAAIKFIKNTESGKIQKSTITFKDNRPHIQAFPIICNENQCSYYDGMNSFIVNLSEIQKIEAVGIGIKNK